jgi:hypothetical protein
MGVGNQRRYNIGVTFETFPFPEGLTPDIHPRDFVANPTASQIASASARLNELRQAWLNPPDLVRFLPEVIPGFPDRAIAIDGTAAVILKRRTLTDLYNERPAWLANAHRDLDEAVTRAYGWTDELADNDILARLLALNQARAATTA